MDDFAFVERLSADLPGVQREKRVDAVGLRGGIDARRAKPVPFVAGVARLLQQFPLCGSKRLLAGIDRAGGKVRTLPTECRYWSTSTISRSAVRAITST